MASIAEINGLTIPSSGGGFTGLLDETYGSGAAAAYSTRRLASATTVLLRVRRVTGTGNTGNDDEANFKFDTATDDLTLSSPIDDAGSSSATNLGQFLNATGYTDADSLGSPADGFVDTWTDQSGNSNNAEQNTPGSQPQIFDSSSPTDLIKENGKPAIYFSGTLVSTNTLSIGTSQRSVFHVTHDDQVNPARIHYGLTNASSGNGSKYNITGETAVRVLGFATWTNDQLDSQSLAAVIMTGSQLSDVDFYKNGSLKTRTGLSDRTINTATGNLVLGGEGNGLNTFIGRHQEFILWISNQSSNRSAIETDINSHFSIF